MVQQPCSILGQGCCDYLSTIAKKYIRGLTLAGCVTGGSKSYYQYDAHGNVVQLTNASGVVTQSYDYDAFGNQFSPSLTDSNLFWQPL